MNPNIGDIPWALLAAAAVALLVLGGVWPVTARRRRQHRVLVHGAVARMCEQLAAGRPTPLRRLGRDVLDVLVRQESAAQPLDGSPADTGAASSPADLALLVSAEAVTARHARTFDSALVDDGGWRTGGQAPHLGGHPRLAIVCDQMRRTIERRLTRAVLVLDEAVRLGEAGDGHDRLRTALSHVRDELDLAEERETAGDVLGALRVLTHLELPVPDEGVPGRADVPALKAQTNALAKVALGHREALDAYRDDHRSASHEAGEETT